MNIKAKDVEAFGRVLKAMGDLCEKNPEHLVRLVSQLKEPSDRNSPFENEAKLKDLERLDLFDLAKGKNSEELMTYLEQYDVEQLRYLARRYRFGVLKRKSWQALATHLVDQVLKRQIDVFSSHQ